MSILISVLLGIWSLVALLMIFVILMQRPKSEGLGAAFGGAVTENIFGAQTTNVLVKFTGWLAGIFFVLTFSLSVLYAHRSSAESGLRREIMKATATAPEASPAAALPAVPGPSVAGSVAPMATPGLSLQTTPAPGASPVASAPALAPSAAPATDASASPETSASPKGKRRRH